MDAILGTDRDAAIAARLGLSDHNIEARRKELGIAGYVQYPQKKWTPEDDALLGTDILKNVSAQLGRPVSQIHKRMLELGVNRFTKPVRPPSQKTLDRERVKLERSLRKTARYYEKLQQGADIAEGVVKGRNFKEISADIGVTNGTAILRLKRFLLIMKNHDKLGALIPLQIESIEQTGYWRRVPIDVLAEAARLARIEIAQRAQSISE